MFLSFVSWQKVYQKILQFVYITLHSLTYQEAFSAFLNVIRKSFIIMIGWVRSYQFVFDIVKQVVIYLLSYICIWMNI